MRFKYFFLGVLWWGSLAKADESSVYLCRHRNAPLGDYVVRMKKYFDPIQKMHMGKVDRVFNAEVLESTVVKVYQIPLVDKESYVQLWYGDQVTVDAHLTYDQGRRSFHAIYKKKSEKIDLICQEIRD